MRKVNLGAAAVLAVVALSGCASFRGGQKSVLGSSIGAVSAAEFQRDKIISDFGEADGEQGKRAYRAKIAGLFMDAIDEEYDRYTKQLFNEGVESNMAFETAVIGLASAATLAEDAASDLAAITAAVAGVDATVDKNLYFDRTLPALIATMDARRATVEGNIIANLQLSASAYPVELLLRDLRRYQSAGMLFRAITEVTAGAAEEKNEAEAERQRQFERARAFSCVPEEDQTAQLTPIIAALNAAYPLATRAAAPDQAAAVRVRQIAAAVGADPLGDLAAVRLRIFDRLDQDLCTVEQLKDVNDRFRAIIGPSG